MDNVKLCLEEGVSLPAGHAHGTWRFRVGGALLLLECRFRAALEIALGDASYLKLDRVHFLGRHEW